MSEPGSILAVNAGSSSLKFALFTTGDSLEETARGEIENLDAAPHFVARNEAGVTLAKQDWPTDTANKFETVLDALLQFAGSHLGSGGLKAVGHRVVHGGADHIAPALVTPALLEDLDALTRLDPLHMPHNLAPIRAISVAKPQLPQVACFDTAFHHTLPMVAREFALPRAITESGVRRYGFHGLSYEFIAGRLAAVAPKLAQGKVIAAHLGAGASLCALSGGVSIATTTGFSALDGLVMATRCGRLDPGVLLYLGRQGHSVDDMENMLYRECGLLGVSGISGDLRVLLESAEPNARQAMEMFTYSIACETGSLVSALGGLDGLVFTAGIGEHAPAIRSEVAQRLSWLGMRLDEAANASNAGRISTPDSSVEVHVIATDEEAMIARHTASLTGAA